MKLVPSSRITYTKMQKPGIHIQSSMKQAVLNGKAIAAEAQEQKKKKRQEKEELALLNPLLGCCPWTPQEPWQPWSPAFRFLEISRWHS
ncbi:hypothetical protein PoB_000799300 [Plakobranchus ocellatus]|uniref:Small EDRK-rich factor-like N-terminal domain-containing protein n=1 Tax=Plakobranchus ocellatus TaxID=259542 RepID=A0AAV3YH76_9GAST|nr:hypothetical protein PoB_000799300 [Plakobranchus ocellatus]